MRVILYDTQHFGPKCEVGRFTLRECFPDPDDYAEAVLALWMHGEFRCGGGAAPPMLLLPLSGD